MALADKIDTLVGFWAIDEKPTGSKDPMRCVVRRWGVIRIILDNNLRFPIGTKLISSNTQHKRLAGQNDDAIARSIVDLLSFFR